MTYEYRKIRCLSNKKRQFCKTNVFVLRGCKTKDFVLQNLRIMQDKRVCFARMQGKGFCFAKFAFYARQTNLMCMQGRNGTSCLYAVEKTPLKVVLLIR